MCVRLKIWTKARQYLERSLALAPSASAWEALGDTYTDIGDAALAQRCYRNAIALARGDNAEPLPVAGSVGGRLDTRPIAIEERDAHGVPRLRE
jgi:HemY protein